MAGTNNYAKLDEWLRHGETSNIDGVCREVGELVQLVRQSHRPPDVFFIFCMKLFDRVFGENTTLCDCPTGWVRSYNGSGWLRKLSTTTSSTLSREYSSYSPGSSSVNSSPGDALNKLIATLKYNGDLLEVLKRSHKDFEALMSMLPMKAQLCLLKHPMYSCVESENQVAYFRLLTHPLHTQLARAGANLRSGDLTITLDALEYFIVCLLRYPTVAMNDDDRQSGYRTSGMRYHHTGSGSGSGSGSSAAASTAMSQIPPPPTTSAIGQPNNWVRSSAYLALLKRFIEDLLDPGSMPVNTPGSAGTVAGKSPAGRSTFLSTPGSASSPGGALVVNADIKYPTAHARLFLTLAAEYWIDTAKVVRHHGEYLRYLTTQHSGVQGLQNHSNRHKHSNGASPAAHTPPTDTILLDAGTGKGSSQWSPSTLQATYVLLQKLLADPTLARQYDAVSTLNVTQGGYYPSSEPRRRGGGGSPYTSGGDEPVGSACPPCLDMLHQPIYDMLRCIFNHGAEIYNCTVFTYAVEIWLLYIQPWKQQPHSSDQIFSKKWRTYVAANLHFYSTLLACFLKTAARVDLLPSADPKEPTHFQNLERVLEVFSNDGLILTIDNLLDDFVYHWYPCYTRAERALSAPLPLQNSTLAEMTAVRAQHVILYPDASIDQLEFHGITILQDQPGCKADCELLSDTLQKIGWRFSRPKRAGACVRIERKLSGLRSGGTFAPLARAVDGAVSWVHGLFDLTEARSETEERRRVDFLTRLEGYGRRVSTLANIDFVRVSNTESADGLSDAPSDEGRAATAAAQAVSADDLTDRNEVDGKLTQRGRERLLRGETKCRREEVRSVRDTLDLPLCSYEVPLVARTLIAWSKQLNRKYALPRDSRAATWSYQQIMREALRSDWSEMPASIGRSFRFNLRYLATARAMAATGWCWVVLLWVVFGDWAVSNGSFFLVTVVCSYIMYRG